MIDPPEFEEFEKWKCEKCNKLKESVVVIQTYNFEKEELSKNFLCQECYIQYKKNRKKSILCGLTQLINTLTQSKTFGFSLWKNNKEIIDDLVKTTTEYRVHIRNSKGVINPEMEERFYEMFSKLKIEE